jgi:hypothetical protein
VDLSPIIGAKNAAAVFSIVFSYIPFARKLSATDVGFSDFSNNLGVTLALSIISYSVTLFFLIDVKAFKLNGFLFSFFRSISGVTLYG